MSEAFVGREELKTRADEMIANNEAPFSIALVDIDNFESINETYGVRIGDAVIKKIASVLRRNLSESDLITRKGDEFTILLSGKGAERSFMHMEEIRSYLSDNTFSFSSGGKNENVYITLSCGIASYPRDAKTSVELLRIADSALFRAKRIGKNKVCLSEIESMVLKSNYFTKTQMDRLSELAKQTEKTEAFLLREALDDLLKKYSC